MDGSSSKTLTRAELTNSIRRKLGLTHEEASQFVTDFFNEISASLARNEPVNLMNFGKFDLIDKNARPGLNPKTGEVKTVAARRVVTFRPSATLRRFIQERAEQDVNDAS